MAKTKLRVVLFVDGENARNACGKTYYTNKHELVHYDLLTLELCRHPFLVEYMEEQYGENIELSPGGTRFYTGYPTEIQHESGHGNKMRQLEFYRSRGITTFQRPLADREYLCRRSNCGARNNTFICKSCNQENKALQEKGVDVALAVDVLSLAMRGAVEVVAILSNDSDYEPLMTRLPEIKRKKSLKKTHPKTKYLELFNVVWVLSTGFMANKVTIFKDLFERIKDPSDYSASKSMSELCSTFERQVRELAKEHPDIYGCYKGFKYDHKSPYRNRPQYLMGGKHS